MYLFDPKGGGGGKILSLFYCLILSALVANLARKGQEKSKRVLFNPTIQYRSAPSALASKYNDDFAHTSDLVFLRLEVKGVIWHSHASTLHLAGPKCSYLP